MNAQPMIDCEQFKRNLVGDHPFVAGWFCRENPQAEYLVNCAVYPTGETVKKFDAVRASMSRPPFFEEYNQKALDQKYQVEMTGLGIDLKSHYNTVCHSFASYCYLPDDLGSPENPWGMQNPGAMPSAMPGANLFFQSHADYSVSLIPFVYEEGASEQIGFSLVYSPLMLHCLVENLIEENLLPNHPVFTTGAYLFDSAALMDVLVAAVGNSGCGQFLKNRGVDMASDRIRYKYKPDALIQLQRSYEYIYANQGFVPMEITAQNPADTRYLFTVFTNIAWASELFYCLADWNGPGLYGEKITCSGTETLPLAERYCHRVNTKKYVDTVKKALPDTEIQVTGIITKQLLEFGDLIPSPVLMEVSLSRAGQLENELGFLLFANHHHLDVLAAEIGFPNFDYSPEAMAFLMDALVRLFFHANIPQDLVLLPKLLDAPPMSGVACGTENPGYLYFTHYPQTANPCTVVETDDAGLLTLFYYQCIPMLVGFCKEYGLGRLIIIDSHIELADGRRLNPWEHNPEIPTGESDAYLRLTFVLRNAGDGYEIRIPNIALDNRYRNQGMLDQILERLAVFSIENKISYITFVDTVNHSLANKLVLKYKGTLDDLPVNGNYRDITLNPEYILEVQRQSR